jgi:hypothetical protein
MVLSLQLAGGARPDDAAVKTDPAAYAMFDADPMHSWNQLHRQFYVRPMGKGQTYIHRGPDAPFGREGKFLIVDPSHTQALAALDAFLKARDDERVKEPLKRALLQRDLWCVFDKLAEPSPFHATDPAQDRIPQRRAVQKRLALVMRRLEQPAAQLRAIPDNYAVAVKSRAFPTAYDPKHPEQPYLPADLRVEGKGEWVPISARADRLAAPMHARFVDGRSVFLPFLRLPGGRKATQDYIATMPVNNDKGFVQLPIGAEVALVRRMILMDDQGELHVTPITENVQIRIFPKGEDQLFFEFSLDRAGLLAGQGGLRAIGPDDSEFFGFGDYLGNQIDPFSRDQVPKPGRVLADCIACHKADKLFSLNTFGFGMTVGYHGAATTDLATQARLVTKGKTASFSWGLLRGMRETPPP